MHHSSEKPKTKNSIFTILIALIFFYGMGHLVPAFIPASTSPLFSLNGPSTAYAEEDEDDEEDEEDDEDDDDIENKEYNFETVKKNKGKFEIVGYNEFKN
jgi:hypothetical protein